MINIETSKIMTTQTTKKKHILQVIQIYSRRLQALQKIEIVESPN